MKRKKKNYNKTVKVIQELITGLKLYDIKVIVWDIKILTKYKVLADVTYKGMLSEKTVVNYIERFVDSVQGKKYKINIMFHNCNGL